MQPMTPDEQDAYFAWRIALEREPAHAEAAFHHLHAVVTTAIRAGDVTDPAYHPSHSYQGAETASQKGFFAASAPSATVDDTTRREPPEAGTETDGPTTQQKRHPSGRDRQLQNQR